MRRIVFLVGVLSLLGSPAAYAGTKILATAPALVSYPGSGQTMRCNILNLNTKPSTVTIEALDYFGGVVSATGPITINPQSGAEHTDTSSGGQAAWCRFTVDGSTKKYRAVATYHDAAGYTTVHAAQ